MDFVLCTSSDNALYLYQVFAKISQRVWKLLSGQNFHGEIFKRGIIPLKM